LSLQVFTESTPPPNTPGGGLAKCHLFGSLTMVSLATALATPIGVLAGVYLAEYGQRSWLARVTRFINDILLSAPSIVMACCLCSGRCAREVLFRLGRRAGAGADRDPGRCAYNRKHAATQFLARCAKRPTRWARPSGA